MIFRIYQTDVRIGKIDVCWRGAPLNSIPSPPVSCITSRAQNVPPVTKFVGALRSTVDDSRDT